MNKKNIMYKAGVLLIAVIMVSSMVPAVMADSGPGDREDDYLASLGITNDNPVETSNNIRYTGIPVPYSSNPTFSTVIFEQLPHTPSDSWSIGTSTEAYGANPIGPYEVFENFWGVSGGITDVHWWGLTLTPPPWSGGSPVGMTFNIEFFDDSITSTAEPVSMVASFPDIAPTFTMTGDLYSGYELVKWEFDLPSSVSLAEGWVSIQSSGSPAGTVMLWCSAQTGDGYSYQAGAAPPQTAYDRALVLTGGGDDDDDDDCIPDACDFQILGINNVEDGGIINSLPNVINVTIRNGGEIPITELKLLADVYEKVCGESNQWCDDLGKDKYDPRFDDDNENWTIYDDPADDADDEGDTFDLQVDEFHSAGQSYRCTQGKYRASGDEDVYVGRSAAIDDDALIWEPADVSHRSLAGAAGGVFTFWHKTTGEYTTDEDDNVIPIDYGHISYSLDDGATWTDISLADFVAYDNAWEQWTIKFINTDANGGHYDTVCDAMACDGGADRTICIEEDFTTAGATFLKVKFEWHVNPCHEYEGWYIDDVCFERVEEYQLELVFQTHEIIDLDACTTIDYEFPLPFDPEPETWYQLCIYGQVFAPANCEADLDNNELCIQFYIDDVHDIACVGIDGPSEGDIGDHLAFDVTVKNVGTFPETEFPVDLKVAKAIINIPIDEDFEADPSGGDFNFYYFTGYDPENYFQWTEGYDEIVGERSAYPGDESIICAYLGYDYPMLLPHMGNLMTDDQVHDYSDITSCESATLFFSAKWAIPAGVGGACMLIHPTEGPDSAYWWITDFGAWNPASDDYQNSFVDFELDIPDLQESFEYDDGSGMVSPPVEFGFGLITYAGISDLTVDTPEGPWGGVQFDNIQIEHIYADGSVDVVDTVLAAKDNGDLVVDPEEILEVGEEETVTLWWNDTAYCSWFVLGDAQLSTDVDPTNDICCTRTSIDSDELIDDLEWESQDLTCCWDESLWHLCSSRPPMDDTFWWCGNEATGLYDVDMDDSLIVSVDLSTGTGGAILEFDTYFMIEDGWDFGEVFVRANDASAWILLGTYTGYEDWHLETLGIPPGACSEDSELRFRFRSDESAVDEGWYVDDICLYSILYGPALEEGFEGGVIPTGWSVIDYSGTGTWEVVTYGTTYYAPPGTGTYHATADSDSHNTLVFDTELFTPSMDFSSALGIVTVDLEHSFEDYAGMGEATICTYSGGSLEETLLYMDLDGDDGDVGQPGAHFADSFDPLSYADPSDVQLGFWYTTNGGTYAWSYSIDDVLLQTASVGGLIACDGDGDVFEYETHRTCAGDFWEETDTEYLLGFTDDYYGDGTVLLLEGYGGDGLGLNNAIYTEIDLTDPELSYAMLEVAHQWILEPGCDVYIEISDEYDPEDCMGTSDAAWTTVYHDGIPESTPDGAWVDSSYPDWQIAQADVSDYLGGTVYLRCRFTTVGNGMFISGIGGWMVDNEINMVYKEFTFVDETPPVTTLVFDDLTGTVSLFAYDPAGPVSSGVCATYYKLDGGSTTEYTASFTLGEGKHTVEYWSVDCVDNEESHKTSPQLVVDTTPPTVEITAPENALYLFGSKLFSMSKPFCIGKVTIAADAQDTGTGITMVTFDIDGDTGYANSAPYEYTYRGMKFGGATATVTAYDGKGLTAQDSIDFTIFSLGLI